MQIFLYSREGFTMKTHRLFSEPYEPGDLVKAKAQRP